MQKLGSLNRHTSSLYASLNNTLKYYGYKSSQNIVKVSKMDESTSLLNVKILKEIFDYKKTTLSDWIVESKIKSMCTLYKRLSEPQRFDFILQLSKDYAICHESVAKTSQALFLNTKVINEQGESTENVLRRAKQEEAQRLALTPHYSWLFKHIGRLENGVKFLVDFRTDIMDCINENKDVVELQQLNNTLKELLSMWFSVGFLRLERVTWQSPCELLQKISEYEAVHPMRSWTDLKRRVGIYRRCFVYLHNSMPGEPLVVLHTALADEICSSVSGIVSSRSRMSTDNNRNSQTLENTEDTSLVKAAVFYSITSTQRGLNGIELGNYLIKRVVNELQLEFPNVTQFSSLSPIPNFKPWLIEKIKLTEKGHADFFTTDEVKALKDCLPEVDFWNNLRRLFYTNQWIDDPKLGQILEIPLLRLCARYLFLEKRRGYALDSVGHFHLKNGAVLWRINWKADLSPRGLTNSCGMMVNYRYFLDKTEDNSRDYIENKIIASSESIKKLVNSAEAIMIVSKL